jgi:hypothetical protein
MNSLNKVLAKAAGLGMLQWLARRDLVTSMSLYADDVVIFCHPDETELHAVQGILELFGHASGMHTNFAKCSVYPIACSDEQAVGAVELIECQLAHFPVKYLGIPLSTRRLTAESFKPLLDRLADKLLAWRASMMLRAGRLALIRVVLAAIPLHQLMVLGLNKKTLKRVHKILRGFLWEGRAEANGGHCHVNWARVCRPLNLGGSKSQTSHGWLSALGCAGCRGCARTPYDRGAGWTCSSRRRSWTYLRHPLRWWWATESPLSSGRTDGWTTDPSRSWRRRYMRWYLNDA